MELDLKRPHVKPVAVQELQEKPVINVVEQVNKAYAHPVPEQEKLSVHIVMELKI